MTNSFENINLPRPGKKMTFVCMEKKSLFGLDDGNFFLYFTIVFICNSFILCVFSVRQYQLDITVKQGRDKVRELFERNAHIKDLRTIDLLVIKVSFKVKFTIPNIFTLISSKMTDLLKFVTWL